MAAGQRGLLHLAIVLGSGRSPLALARVVRP